MNFSFFLAKRYLQTNRENRFFSWISTLSIFGVAIGVAAMIVVLSVINGFEKELRNRFLAANAHVMAYRFPSGLQDYDLWQTQIKKDFSSEVSHISPFVYSESMIRRNYQVHSVIIKGIYPNKRELVQSIEAYIRPKAALTKLQGEIDSVYKDKVYPEFPGIILGSHLGEELGVSVGDTVEVMSPVAGETKDRVSYKVLGFYDSGLQHYDKQLVLMSLVTAQRLMGLEKKNLVTGLEIGLKEPDKSIDISEKMKKKYRLTIKEWQSYNRNIIDTMRDQRNVIGLIVALVAFVASFNILTTLFISVTQKRRDIALLKALGASNIQIVEIFIKQSFLIGLAGSLLGVVIGALFCQMIEKIPFIDLPNIYLLAHLPATFDPKTYLIISLGSVLIAVLAGIYPSLSASSYGISDGLKETGDQ
jgi:lipoprotein-releasing system permease protein